MIPTNKLIRRIQTLPLYHLILLITVLVFIGRVSLLSSRLPINDGGIFLSLVQTLSKHIWQHPETLGYNQSAIPFAYPPLGIYIQAIITRILPLTALALFTLVPFFVSLCCIPVWFYLSYRITGSRSIAVFSTLLAAGIPESFQLLIMGAGITRAWGTLFGLLLLVCIDAWQQSGKRKWYLLSGVCLGLVVITHPDATVFSAIIGTLFWFRRTKKITPRSLPGYIGIGSIAGIIAAPWMLSVIQTHGLSPFAAASQTRRFTELLASNIFWIFKIEFPYRWLLLFTCIGIYGTLKQKRHIFLLVWLILAITIRSNSMLTFDIFPFALLGGIGISAAARLFFNAKLVLHYYVYCLIFMSLTLFWSAAYIGKTIPRLQQTDYELFATIRKETPPTASFLIITPEKNWWNDHIPEWFPALTDRKSILTVQGTEWLPQHEINRRIKFYQEIRRCNTEDVECIEYASRNNGVSFTHIYMALAKDQPGVGDYCPLLLRSIRTSSRYREMNGTTTGAVWERIE